VQKSVLMEDGTVVKMLEDIVPLKLFKNLQSLNLCSTYFPLEFQAEPPDEQNDQMISIAGSRELELVFFNLKNQLRILHLGYYIYDELLNYVAEMCKGVEKLEINSEYISDRSISQVLIKMTKLLYIDVSACPHFLGVAIQDAGEHFGAKDLKRFVAALDGYEKQKV
jgi:hypothetical protein